MQTDNKLTIRLIDRLRIEYKGKRIEGALESSKKARMLVEFLVLSEGEPVTVNTLHETLWKGANIRNPDSALRVLVSRTRAMFAEVDPRLRNCITADLGVYSWNMFMTGYVDVIEVRELCGALQKMNAYSRDYKAKLVRLVSLYKTGILKEDGEEAWIALHALKLEEMYKEAIHHSIHLLWEAQAYSALSKLCKVCMTVLPYDEEVHTGYIRALNKMQQSHEAHAHYWHMQQMYTKNLGMPLPDMLQELSAEMGAADASIDNDISIIHKELLQGAKSSEKELCEYSVFAEIYRVYVRTVEQGRGQTCLAVTKIVADRKRRAEEGGMDEIMAGLLSILVSSLRKGDLITRYSASQYAVLMECPGMEVANAVMERVEALFAQQFGHMGFQLEHRINLMREEMLDIG